MRTKQPLREPVREAPGPRPKNYITPAGLQRLRDEHRFLLTRERPAVTEVVAWAAGNGDRSENADYLYGKRRLRQIDSRIRFLTKRIDSAVVVDPAASRTGAAARQVFFGATVNYRDAADREHVVCIVGVDEVDLNRRYISWMSPLARALMKGVGAIASCCTPPERRSRSRSSTSRTVRFRWTRSVDHPGRHPRHAPEGSNGARPFFIDSCTRDRVFFDATSVTFRRRDGE